MRKLVLFILTIAMFACSQQPDGFKINVELEGAAGDILLEKRGESMWIPVDTAEVVDGIAVLEGKTEYPREYYLSVLGQRNKTVVFVENSNINVTGKVDSLRYIKVTGSDVHDEYESLNKPITALSEEYMQLYQQAQQTVASGDTTKAEELMEKVNEMYMSTVDMQKEFVKNNPGSYVSPYILMSMQNRIEVEPLDSLVSVLEPHLLEIQGIQSLKDRITRLKKVSVGQVAPDFTMNDPDGNPITFSEIYSKNELTLLDFWAGWCGPCRQENPNVVAVYNEFKDEGFTVFGVSLDREKEGWLRAIEEDNLTWTHVSDLAYWQNAAAKMYEVRGIPASFLVDNTGKIVAKNKRGDELRQAVDEHLN